MHPIHLWPLLTQGSVTHTGYAYGSGSGYGDGSDYGYGDGYGDTYGDGGVA